MADLIVIERKTGATGEWGQVYSGAWSAGQWLDESSFTNGVTYYYRAKRVIDDVPSAYSNEDSVTYIAIPSALAIVADSTLTTSDFGVFASKVFAWQICEPPEIGFIPPAVKDDLVVVVGSRRVPLPYIQNLDVYEQWPGGCAEGSFFIPGECRALPINGLGSDAPVEVWCNTTKLWTGWVSSTTPVAENGSEGWQVECEGPLGRFQHRRDLCRVYKDNDYGQWRSYDTSSKYFTFSNDGMLEAVADPGTYLGGHSWRWWYWLHDGLGPSADVIHSAIFSWFTHVGSSAWSAELAVSTTIPYPHATIWDWDDPVWSKIGTGETNGQSDITLPANTRALCFRFKCLEGCTISTDRYMRITTLRLRGVYLSSYSPHLIAGDLAENVCGIPATKIVTATCGTMGEHWAERPYTTPAEALLAIANVPAARPDWGFTLDGGFRFVPLPSSPPATATFTAHHGSPGVTLNLGESAEEGADYFGFVYPTFEHTNYPDGTYHIIWDPATPPAYSDPKRVRVFRFEGGNMSDSEAATYLGRIADFYILTQTLGTVHCDPGARLETPGGTPCEAWRLRPGQWLRQRDSAFAPGYITGRRLQQTEEGLAVEFDVGETLESFAERLGVVSSY